MTTLVFGGTGFIGRRHHPQAGAGGGSRPSSWTSTRHRRDYSPRTATPSGSRRGTSPAFEDVIKAIMGRQAGPHHEPRLPARPPAEGHAPLLTRHQHPRHGQTASRPARLCGVNRVTYASSIAVSGLQTNFGDRMTNEDGRHARQPPVR